MGLEVVAHISDLVITNPVGATDPKSQGDDHIRNIKKALKTDLPAITGPVLASQAELNILDGALVTTAELNLLSGLTLTAAQINDAARKSANNTFTGVNTLSSAGDANHLLVNAATVQSFYGSGTANARLGTISNHGYEFYTNNILRGSISNAGVWTLSGVASTDFARLSQANTFTSGVQRVYAANGSIRLKDTGGTADKRVWDFVTITDTLVSRLFNDAEAGSVAWLTVTGGGALSIASIALSATAITVNGVNVTDFARLSQSNNFTGASQLITQTDAMWRALSGTIDMRVRASTTDTRGYVGTASAHSLSFMTNGNFRATIDSSGNFDFSTGTATFGGTLTSNSSFQANSSVVAAGSFATSNTITPTALSASQNDYAPTGHATASIFRLDPNGNTPATITGIAGGSPGRRIILYRIPGTTGTIDLARENASSAAANRIATGTAAFTLTTQLVAFELIYDTTASRWIVIGGIS